MTNVKPLRCTPLDIDRSALAAEFLLDEISMIRNSEGPRIQNVVPSSCSYSQLVPKCLGNSISLFHPGLQGLGLGGIGIDALQRAGGTGLTEPQVRPAVKFHHEPDDSSRLMIFWCK